MNIAIAGYALVIPSSEKACVTFGVVVFANNNLVWSWWQWGWHGVVWWQWSLHAIIVIIRSLRKAGEEE